MKFSDFPKEHVIINVYDALDELYLDYPLKVYPFFFDRLRSALEYLDISSESIKGLNFDNQESYLSAIYDLLKEAKQYKMMRILYYSIIQQIFLGLIQFQIMNLLKLNYKLLEKVK